jgi:hypothetical protein
MPALGTHWPYLRSLGGGSPNVMVDGKWVGTKAALEGDLLTIDANGRFDQAVAAGANVGAATKLAFCNQTILSSEAANFTMSAEKFSDENLIELQAVDAAGAVVATAQAKKGDQQEIRRCANGQYAVDTATSANAKVEIVGISPRYPVGEVGGYYLCRVLAAARVA